MILILIVIIGFFAPIIPVRVKNGFNGIGGEFCGIVYHPECDQISTRFFTTKEAFDILKYERVNHIQL